MKAQQNGSAPSSGTDKPAAKTKVSLVETASERFEEQTDLQAAAASKTRADEYRQRARDRLQLLQGSGLALTPAAHEKTIAFTTERRASAPTQQRSPSLKYIVVGTCILPIAAFLLHQINMGAISAPSARQTFAGTVSVRPTPPSPRPSPQIAAVPLGEPDEGISLQLSMQLTLPVSQK